jgi:hypothetical protein
MSDSQVSESTSTENTENAPSLSVGDLTQVLQVFQVVATRGAFRADELSSVGGLYDRLVAFLKATGALKEPEATENTTGEEAAEPVKE